MVVPKVGSQLESIDKKTEDTMNSLKELQQVCANVLKEFHQVSVFLIIIFIQLQRLVHQEDSPNHTRITACPTSVQKHISHRYPALEILMHPCSLTNIQVTNTFDDKVGNFSKNLRMEFRSISYIVS